MSAAGVGLLLRYAETMLAVRSMKFLLAASVMIGPSPKSSAQTGSDSIASRKYAREQAELLLNMRGMLAQRQERRRFIFGAVQSQVEKPTTVTDGGRDAHATHPSRQTA